MIIVVAVITVTAAQRAKDNKNNLVQSVANDTVGLIDKGLSYPVKFVQNAVSSVGDLINTYQENKDLKAKIDSYDEAVIKNKNYEKEIDQLKQELELNETLTSYDKVTANVITRSPDTWQDMLIVDRGSKDGIEVNMAVMSQKGLIGRVIEVNALSSKVELLTSANQNANHFPVRISSKDGNAYGLLKSYDEDHQAFVVSQLTGNTDLKKGDVVQTSGLGGNSPADLLIGTVEEIKPDKFGLERQVYVKPYSELYDISVVTIVKRLVEDGQ
ncbi:rod shape-determining protein MreC [Enterococcus canis]|uniref:Cell shape-determining protein MreC n=1 Tax=Enterococcus canis TaxID=214095 RepID=A0A1L8RGD9_9ENTE|nr:rod shape-determining protein MreC [Enterococcus canis]